MITLSVCSPEQSQELSEYLHPIWHEAYDSIELGGPEGVEYIFSTWVSPDAIRKSFSEGYEYGYIRDDGARIGMYAYRIEGDRFYISKLYLEQKFRGRGFGKSVMELFEEIAIMNGCGCVYLSAFFYNKNAMHAYERYGFHLHYRCLRYLGNGIVQNDAYMLKELQ